MASTILVDKIDPQSGTALEIGTSGDTITIPAGVNANLGSTGSTITIPSGSTIVNSGTATGFGANTPAFSVKLTSTQTISNSSETKVAHNSTLLDTNSGWDSSNYKYVFPTTGYYLVTHSLRYVSTTAPRLVSWVRRNGSGNENLNSVETNPNNSASAPTTGGSFIFSFTAGDYIEHYTFQNSGSSKDLEVSTNPHLICFLQATKLIGV